MIPKMLHAMRRPSWRPVLAIPIALGLVSTLAIAQPAQTPPPTKHAQGHAAAPGSATLTARLIDGDSHAQHGEAYVDVQVSGLQLIDPATVKEQPQDGQGHVHYQIDDGPVIATTATKLGFHDLKPGPHQLKVMLAANDHSPLGPAETLAINGDFASGAGEHGKGAEHDGDRKDKDKDKSKADKDKDGTAHAKEKASLSVKLVDAEAKAAKKAATVEVTVTGLSLTDPVGAEPGDQAGQGHLHYRVDDGPVIATSMKKLSFHELRSGAHKIKVALASGDHKTLGAEQTVEVTIP